MKPIIELSGVTLQYPAEKHAKPATILENIDLTVAENDIIALLGPSGCGKSTLIRLVAGLIAPTSGTVKFHGQEVRGICPGVSMVFQNFALFPGSRWRETSRFRSSKWGSTTPRSRAGSSGISRWSDSTVTRAFIPENSPESMKQRVGIARALAVNPEVLCMDEPFSALDVLTAESLRDELARLCADPANPLRTMLSVTHNIEEAVFLAKRIIVLAAHPGRVALDIPNPLPYPRKPDAPEFVEIVEKIHAILTHTELPEPPVTAEVESLAPLPLKPIPHATIGEIMGLVSLCKEEPQDIFALAEDLNEEFTGMLAVVKAAEMLGFVTTPHDMVALTPDGRRFQDAPMPVRKEMLSARISRLGIFNKLRAELVEKQKLSGEEFLHLLAMIFPTEKPELLARFIVGWGRYVEAINYDSGSHELSLGDAAKEALSA